MSSELVPVKSAAEFRLSELVSAAVEKSGVPMTRSQQAAMEMFRCFDGVWQAMPPLLQDLSLRFFSSHGLLIDYPTLPFWAERAAKHFFTICYPTLRKCDFNKPSQEDFGRVVGHMLAIVAHAKQGTAIFQRLPEPTTREMKEFCLKIEMPLRVLIDEAISLPPDEAGAFMSGLSHAFRRTFDISGWPMGWNTNSPILIGICLGWRMIVTQSPTLPFIHKELVKVLGENAVGSEDRVKKICHRAGLRFSGSRTGDSQGTTEILDVPSVSEEQSR